MADTDARVRTILLVEMDAFYVSVELRRHPELRGRPVVVGGSGSRGVVAAANYEARRFGVFSAMPSSRARRLCPQAVFLPGDHALYAEVSEEVHQIFEDVTPLVEPIALDEAFLDVTGARSLFGDGESIGHLIRRRISDELDLRCSVGVATSKFVAKLASKGAKPRVTPRGVEDGPGVLVVEPGRERDFVSPLPVEALWGVGPATLARLERLGVRRVSDLAALPDGVLERSVGPAHGRHLASLARAEDDREVVPHRAAKSIGNEETFAHDLVTVDEIRREVVRLCDHVAARLRRHGRSARTVTLKIRFSTFETITRSVTPTRAVNTSPGMMSVLDPIVSDIARGLSSSIGVRLLGVSTSQLVEPSSQLSLFDGFDTTDGPSVDIDAIENRWEPASRAIDAIRERFGKSAIGPAGSLGRSDRHEGTPWGPERLPEDGGDQAGDATLDDRPR
ncbi:MAG: DNA polymerase IV [Ilumatobacteraceae bacterium]